MDYRIILRQEMQKRLERNPSYSLRAFARDLGILPNRLISVLNRKYGISPKAALYLAEKLGFDQKQTELFCDLVRIEHARSRRERESARLKFSKESTEVKELLSTVLSRLAQRPLNSVKQDELAAILGVEGEKASQFYDVLVRMDIVDQGF